MIAVAAGLLSYCNGLPATLVQRWHSVCDAAPSLNQRWAAIHPFWDLSLQVQCGSDNCRWSFITVGLPVGFFLAVISDNAYTPMAWSLPREDQAMAVLQHRSGLHRNGINRPPAPLGTMMNDLSPVRNHSAAEFATETLNEIL